MNIWLDDQRPGPEGWVHLHNLKEVEILVNTSSTLKDFSIDIMNFDYHLSDDKTGLDVMKYLAVLCRQNKTRKFWPKRVLYHSDDKDGAKLMTAFEIKFEKEKFYNTYGNRVPYYSLIPLDEVIAEVYGMGVVSKKVKEEYIKLIKVFGSELKILIDLSAEELKTIADEKVVKGIVAVREKKLKIEPGFDGEYGKVKIFSEEEKENLESQKKLF